MHPSLVLSDERSPENEQIFEEMYQFCMNDDWEGIGPISNLNDQTASSTPPISVSPVEDVFPIEAVSPVKSVSTVESVSPIERSDRITSVTPDTSVSPVESSEANNSVTPDTSGSPIEPNEANTSVTLATSVALDPSSGFSPPITTTTTSEPVVVFKYPIGNSRAQYEEQISKQNARRIPKKKQDGQDIRAQKMEKLKTPVQVVLPPTPQSQPQYTATSRTSAPALTARYDPSIHQLQVSYEMKQRQARMEYQDKLLAQYQRSQERQTIPQNQQPQQQHVALQPQQRQTMLQLRQLQQGQIGLQNQQPQKQHVVLNQQPQQQQVALQPRVAQHNLPIEQQPKHMQIQQQLSLHSENLNIAYQKLLQENEALLRQPANPQQRQLFQQKYKALVQECREHKIRIAQFHEFKKQASSQNQLREARKLQATQIPVASQSPTVNYLTPPHTNQTHSISSVSSTVAPKRSYSFITTVGPDTKFVANPSNHGQYSVTSSGDHTYLNGPQTKKYKYAL